MKYVNEYILPIIVIVLLIAFLIYASVTSEGFSNNCKCPAGSQLKNGGCYTCESGYKLSTDYYNSYCVSENPNDYGTGKYIKGAKYKSVTC
jgi:hypothetical protein